MTQANPYDRVARSALTQYGITPEQCQFLGHSENVTFCIATRETKFLLRIHHPIAQRSDQVWQNPDVIESELLWLAALHRDTAIVVPAPVKNAQRRTPSDRFRSLWLGLLHF
jgi:Ser/Thr protein kinase RdoA (MazF antagonist)